MNQDALPLTSPADVEHLLSQKKALRVLQPALRQQIEQGTRQNPALASYVFYHQGELYLSLASIGNAQRRAQTYDLIQRYQIDPAVNLHKVPAGLRMCLQPKQNRESWRMGAVAMGAMAGILFGVMGMAIEILMTAVFGFSETNSGATMTAVTFVTCWALGWAATTYYLWRKHPLGF